MNSFLRLLPFYIPLINLGSIFFKSELRIDVVIEIFVFLISLYVVITKKNYNSFVSTLLIFSSFIFFHTFYSYINFPHIFDTVITVNFQLVLILFLIIYYNISPLTFSEIKKASRALNIFGITLLFFQFLSYVGLSVTDTQEISSGSSRYFGIIGDQEAWLFSLFAFLNFRRSSYVVFLVFFIGLLLTGSLGATVIFILALIWKYLLDLPKSLRLIYTAIIILVIPLGFKIAPYVNLPVVSRLFDDALTDDGALGHRIAALENASGEILRKLVLGFGSFAGEMVYQYDDTLSIYEKGKLTYLATSNNQILDVVLNYGIVGLIFFVTFIFSTIKYIKPVGYILNYDFYFMFNRLFYLWFITFLIFNQSSIWFIPGSYIFLVLTLLLCINTSYKEYYTKHSTMYNIV